MRAIDVDASRSPESGLAAIAAVDRGQERILAINLLEYTRHAAQAELCALVAAMEVAYHAGYEQVVFRCDAEGVVRVVNRRRTDGGNELLQRARDYLRDPPPGGRWILVRIPRKKNRAHVVAKGLLRAWRINLERRAS